jgi:hypothetical protein
MRRGFNPSSVDMATALDIAEGIFAAIYIHSENAARRRMTPFTVAGLLNDR